MKESHEISQAEIWNQFISDGNEKSLSWIYAENYDLLYDYGKRITTDDQIVEDAIQDVFINIIKYRKSIGYVKNIKGYLVSSFRRQLLLDMEKQKKMVFSEQLPENFFDFFSSPEQDAHEHENTELMYQAVRECVDSLTNKQKEILYLRFESGISYEDMAEMLDISVDSCYKSIYRTIKALRSAAEKIATRKGNIFFGLSAFRKVLSLNDNKYLRKVAP